MSRIEDVEPDAFSMDRPLQPLYSLIWDFLLSQINI